MIQVDPVQSRQGCQVWVRMPSTISAARATAAASASTLSRWNGGRSSTATVIRHFLLALLARLVMSPTMAASELIGWPGFGDSPGGVTVTVNT